MKNMFRVFFVTTLLFGGVFFVSGNVYAKLGVGVGTGKIIVDEKLKPGIIYELPPLTVINTGDEPAEYSVGVAYHEGQKELMPPIEWFSFKPSRFQLDPTMAQRVDIKLSIPVKTVPGDYFAYVEGYPIRSVVSGDTNIGIAAAAKLYFSVAPASILEGIYYRVISFWNGNQPYSNIVLGLIVFLIVVKIIKKKFNISINVNKKWDDQKNSQ